MKLYLDHRRLHGVKLVNTLLYTVVLVFACITSHSFVWTSEVLWMMGFFAVIPTEIVSIMVAVLRWYYGYAKGVGGATRWNMADTANLILAMICALLYISIVITAPPAGVLNVSVSFWMRTLSFFLVAMIVVVWMVVSVYRDWREWQQNWSEELDSFQSYVKFMASYSEK